MRELTYCFARTVVLLALAFTPLTGCSESDIDAGPAIQQGTLITLENGMIQGEVDGGTRRFFRIPFAKPPLGDLRWRPPQPVEPWQGVLPATEMSLPCAQRDALTTPASDNEDCLYLNVWTPNPAPTEP